MRVLALSVSLMLLAACGGEAREDAVMSNAESPAAVTNQWLDRVAAGDQSAIAGLVEPTGLAIVAAVEGDLRSDELVGLLESGIGESLAAQYWADFRDSFEAFQDAEIADIAVGEATPVPGADSFTSVELMTPGATGYAILRNTNAGWQLDFAATIGPALVGPLGDYLASAIAGEHGEAIASAYRDAIVPGLEVALVLDPDNTRLEFETEYIRQLADT
jgi:hypothetical protein